MTTTAEQRPATPTIGQVVAPNEDAVYSLRLNGLTTEEAMAALDALATGKPVDPDLRLTIRRRRRQRRGPHWFRRTKHQVERHTKRIGELDGAMDAAMPESQDTTATQTYTRLRIGFSASRKASTEREHERSDEYQARETLFQLLENATEAGRKEIQVALDRRERTVTIEPADLIPRMGYNSGQNLMHAAFFATEEAGKKDLPEEWRDVTMEIRADHYQLPERIRAVRVTFHQETAEVVRMQLEIKRG